MIFQSESDMLNGCLCSSLHLLEYDRSSEAFLWLPIHRFECASRIIKKPLLVAHSSVLIIIHIH